MRMDGIVFIHIQTAALNHWDNLPLYQFVQTKSIYGFLYEWWNRQEYFTSLERMGKRSKLQNIHMLIINHMEFPVL